MILMMIILFVIVFIRIEVKKSKKNEAIIFLETGSMIIVVAILWFFISPSIYEFKAEETTETRINLESAKTISNLEGNFYYINTGEKYSSFVRENDGALVKTYFPDSTRIYEKDINKSYLIFQTCKPKETLDFLTGVTKSRNFKCENGIYKNRPFNYRLYVPKGSIQLTTNIK